MQDYRQLRVWQQAHEFVLGVYQISNAFPKTELYGLTSQLRRASISIAANIAEGCGRRTQQEMLHYLAVSMGSASEADYELLLAKDLGYVSESEYEVAAKKLSSVRKMGNVLQQRIRTSLAS